MNQGIPQRFASSLPHLDPPPLGQKPGFRSGLPLTLSDLGKASFSCCPVSTVLIC